MANKDTIIIDNKIIELFKNICLNIGFKKRGELLKAAAEFYGAAEDLQDRQDIKLAKLRNKKLQNIA